MASKGGKDSKKVNPPRGETPEPMTLEAMEERVGRLELAKSEDQDKWHVVKGLHHETVEGLEELESDIRCMTEVLKAQVAEIALHCDERSIDMRTRYDGELEKLSSKYEEEIESLKTKVAVLEKVVANGGPIHKEFTGVKVPEPKSFKGTRDVKELENFLWKME